MTGTAARAHGSRRDGLRDLLSAGLATVGAFVVRDWRSEVSYRLPFLLGTTGIGVQLVLFFFLARIVDPAVATGELPEDLRAGYFSFVVVGLALLRMVSSALTTFAERLRTEQTTGTLEAVLATPISSAMAVGASSSYHLLRTTVETVLTLVVAALVGARYVAEPAALVAAGVGIVAVAGLFAAVGVAVAAFGMVFKRPGALMSPLTIALSLLGGVYFPTEVLPGWLRVLAEALPFTWGVDAVRAALVSGDVDAVRLLALVGAAAVALPLSTWVLGRAVDRARRQGTLAQY